MPNISPKYVVLISSCDAYRDLWSPCVALFNKYWPVYTRPPVYLVTESESMVLEDVTILHSHLSDRCWSNQIRYALNQLKEEWVLLTLEDFFLRASVPSEKIEHILKHAQSQDAHMVRLVARPGPDKIIDVEDGIGEVNPGSPYRVSTQATLWKRASLLRLLATHNESIWEFELNGSQRSDALFPSGFFAMNKDIFPYRHHVVEKGRWFPWEANHFNRLNIGVDLNARPTMSLTQSVLWLGRKVLGIVRKQFRTV